MCNTFIDIQYTICKVKKNLITRIIFFGTIKHYRHPSLYYFYLKLKKKREKKKEKKKELLMYICLIKNIYALNVSFILKFL